MLLKQTKNIRSKLTPQMDIYDRLGVLWQPFLMYFHTPNFSSAHVNTDALGFRYTRFKEKNLSPLTPHFFEDCDISLIVGGSTVFGVGSSSDDQTISSLLSKQNGQVYLNLGGRAFSSTQELILFNQVAHKFPKIKSVIIFSGLNELFLSRKSFGGGYFGNFFFGKQFNESMTASTLSRKRRILKGILYPFYGENINYHNIDIHGLCKHFLTPTSTSPQLSVDNLEKFDLDSALQQIHKNLYIFKQLSESLGFSVKYVLQPSPGWFDKRLSTEEELLFAHLDALNGHNYMSMLSKDLYLEYSSKINGLCRSLNIKFFDSNKFIAESSAFQEWLFVDRAHLTDLGNAVVTDLLNSIEDEK